MARGRRFAGVTGAALGLCLLMSGCLLRDVRTLASDEMAGRGKGTPGGETARRYLIDRLSPRAEPIRPEAVGDDRYLQPIPTGGANVIGIIPGTDLADEYVVVGAHYDGSVTCRGSTAEDTICNSATDNAAGVAVALSIAQDLVDSPPRRSVVIALWDGNEAGRQGSGAYIDDPVVPLAQTVAYVNFDILGSNLLPSLRNTTFAVGAETGGGVLADIVDDAVQAGPLDTATVSAILGSYRSDDASFLTNAIPTVSFSDSAGRCNHHARDDLGAVDFTKLRHQEAMATQAVRSLVDGDVRPTWAAAPLTTFDDVVELHAIMLRSEVDWTGLLFSFNDLVHLVDVRSTLGHLIFEGPEAYDAAAEANFLRVANLGAQVLEFGGTCDAFLPAAASRSGD